MDCYSQYPENTDIGKCNAPGVYSTTPDTYSLVQFSFLILQVVA